MPTLSAETAKIDRAQEATPQRSLLGPATLFLLALFLQLIAIRRTSGPYDEFLSLYGADSVLHGGVPYRDFWTMYGPAQFYAIAGLFKVFGVNAMMGRLYDALIRAGLACVSYSLVGALATRRWALVAYGVVIVWLTCIHYPAYNFPAYAALLFSLLSCLLFARFLRDTSDSRALLYSGLLVSVTTTIRHDSGFYLCASQLVMLAWITFSNRPAAEPHAAAVATFRRLALLYLAGVFVITLPVYLTLLIKAGFHNLFYDLIYVPGVIYPKVRNLPFIDPDAIRLLHHFSGWEGRLALESFIVLFPIFAISSSLLCLVTTRRSRTRVFDTVWQRRTFALLFVLDALFFLKGLIRVSPVQMMQSIVVAVIVLAILLGHLSRFGTLSRVALYGSALYLVVCSYPLAFHLFPYTRNNLVDLFHPQAPNSIYRTCNPPPHLSRARCLILEPDEVAAIEDIQRRTAPDDKIYVGAGRHDRLFWNDVRLYFLSGRSSITPWYDLHPGVQTTLPIQNEIIDAMRRTPAKVVVLNSTWDNTVEPNQSRSSSGVTALDDYIRTHYTAQATYGAITILAPVSQ